MNFLAFLETTSVSVYKNRQWCQTPRHCRYATVDSKSDSEGGFWTDSDVKIWGSDIGDPWKVQYGTKREGREIATNNNTSNITYRDTTTNHREN